MGQYIGELARAVRAYEIGRDRPDEKDATQAERRQELIEEMGDVLGNLAILADKYGITLEDATAERADPEDRAVS